MWGTFTMQGGESDSQVCDGLMRGFDYFFNFL